MNTMVNRSTPFLLSAFLLCVFESAAWIHAQTIPSLGSKLPPLAGNKVVTEADCSAAKLGTTIPVSAVGEPVSGVTLSAPV